MTRRGVVAVTTVMMALIAIALAGCGGSHAQRAVVFPTLSDVTPESGWEQPLLSAAAAELFSDLSTRGPTALIERRIHGDEVAGYYNEGGQRRIAHVMAGLTPHASERRWNALRGFASSQIVGWCARGVRVAESDGAEGFRGRVLTVDRLLLVGQEAGGRWGMWLEGLVYTIDGWRFAPTVPFGEAVQMPRRDHADVDLWDCDLGVRPTPSAN